MSDSEGVVSPKRSIVNEPIETNNRRLTWEPKTKKISRDVSEEDQVRNKALEESMADLVPPPRRTIREDSVVVKHQPLTEVNEHKL